MFKSKYIPFLVLFILLIICAFVFYDYLSFKNAYFFHDIHSDGFYTFYPAVYNIADYISHVEIPRWSFHMGMGQNVFPQALHDPFDILLYIAGKDRMVYLFIYVEVVKIALCGLSMFYYLRMLKCTDYVCAVGAVLFSFCGFIVVGSAWFIFTSEAFNFILFLLAFELLYQKGKWQLFPFAVCFTAVSMPFNLFLFGIFLAVYSIFRLAETNALTAGKMISLFSKMVGLGVLGLLLAGPFFLECMNMLLNSPRGSGDNSYLQQLAGRPVFEVADKLQLGSGIFRFFSNDILGFGSNFKGWDTILGAPLVYCGLPCVLLLPQVFTFSDTRQKVAVGAFLAAWLIPVIFPFFRHAIWAFTGDYYRLFSLFVMFAFFYASIKAMDCIVRLRKINIPLLLITLAGLLTILYTPPFIDDKVIGPSVRSFVTCVLIAYSIVLLLVVPLKSSLLVRSLFFVIVIVEIGYSAYGTANKREFFSHDFLRDKVLYNNYSLDAVKSIQSQDSSFYRIDKNFYPETARFSDLNFSQKQGYNSTASYSSFNQVNYVRYLQGFGIADKTNEQDSRWAIGLLDNPILQSQNNVKYFLSTNGYQPQWPEMWDSLGVKGDVTIYRNRFVLPFGHTYSHFIRESQFDKASVMQRQFITLKAVVIKDTEIDKVSPLKEITLADTFSSMLDFASFKQQRESMETDTLSNLVFSDNSFSGRINVSTSSVLYLSIPFDKGWNIVVDGKKQEKMLINKGMTGVILHPGAHSIELSYHLPYGMSGVVLCLCGIAVFSFLHVWLKKN